MGDEMNYIKNLEQALTYIELNLGRDIEVVDLAKEAKYSSFHFQRFFKAYIGDSVKDYIRKRRMTEAAKELIESDISIIDLAMKYGYKSREGFCRAFLQTYGKPPSKVRQTKQCYASREKLDFESLTFEYNKKSRGLQASIKSLGERYIVGVKYQMKSDGSNFIEIPHLWNEWIDQKIGDEILGSVNNNFLGLCLEGDNDSFIYMIGKEVNSMTSVPQGMSLEIIEPCTYAVFETKGPLVESIQKTIDYIYSQWISSTKYTIVSSPGFEYYYTKKGKLCADIYIPIEL